jgi:hypothetical protein
MSDVWLRCSACKKDIRFGAVHWVCSVSTCNRNRTRLVFCSVPCWDSHVATLRHREAWAVEAKAPSRDAWEREQAELADAAAAAPTGSSSPAPAAAASGGGGSGGSDPIRRRVVNEPPPARTAPPPAEGAVAFAETEREILIVVSKLKKYIRDRSGMNTSDAVAEVLGDYVRNLADDAIRTAAADGRKTVLDRDLPRPRR